MDVPSHSQPAERLRRLSQGEKAPEAKHKRSKALTQGAPNDLVAVKTRRRASLALRQVVINNTEEALRHRSGGLVQDFLRRDSEATRQLSDELNRFLIDSSGSEEEGSRQQVAASEWKEKRQRTHIFADRSFWRRARQIACFEYVSEQMRSSINIYWKESLKDAVDGRQRAQIQAREILKLVQKSRGLETAVDFQVGLLSFRAVLRDRREADAALTNKLHRDGKGAQDFWSIYHKEDSKRLSPSPGFPALPAAMATTATMATGRSSFAGTASTTFTEGEVSAKSEENKEPPERHAALKSKSSQVARKVLQHRCEIQQKRTKPVPKASKMRSIPEIQDHFMDSRPTTRQEQGYFDLGRFLEPSQRRRLAGSLRPASRSLPALPRLSRSTQGGNSSMNSSTSSWRPRVELPLLQSSSSLPHTSWRTGMAPAARRPALNYERSLVVPLSSVAGPFLRPWQSEVRTETGLPEPEAEDDSATMRYIRVCNARGVIPTAGVLEMVRKCAITSGGEFLLDDELTAMSSMIGHLSSICEVCLAGSTKLSDAVLDNFLQQLFGRPAMNSLEKLDLARCRGAGPKAINTLVGLLVESNGLYKLRHLDISGIRISSATMSALCHSVHVHPAIRSLHLQDTNLGVHPNAADCLQDLLNAPALEVLGLGWNCFSEEALKALGDMLASHKRLRELHMPNCDSCVSGVESSTHLFLEGLYRNASLCMLDLSMNRLDSSGALILEDSLARHAKLQELYIGQNPLGSHGLRCLLRLLSQSTCGLRLLEALGCQGLERPIYQASDPSGTYRLDLNLPHSRSLLRLLYKTCETLKLDFQQAFQKLQYTPASSGRNGEPRFQHPSGKDSYGVYTVPTTGTVSFCFCIDNARAALVPEGEGLDGSFRGPRPLASIYLDRHFALLRPKLTFRKVVCLLAQFRSLKGRSDEQKLILDALSSDFSLEYDFLSIICEDSFNSIDTLCLLVAGVARSQVRLFLTLTHLPRLREYIKVYKRCERLFVFNADSPTGRYSLDLRSPTDYAVAEMLKMLDAWETSVARKQNLEDRSQYGNWSSVRNCTHQNVLMTSLADWILPFFETLELDFVTWRRPATDALPFQDRRWDEMMVKLSQAPLAPRAKVHVLRGVCDRLFLTSMQCRQLVGVFGDSECRMAVLCCALMRLSDPQNMKLVQSRLDAKEWKGLRQRMGTLTLFPYIQPEQQDFALDMSIPEDRIAASLVVRLNVKETKRNNIRNPRFVMHDKSEFAFDRGVPVGWQNPQAIPQGGPLTWQYMCSPEDRNMEMRRDFLSRYGGWNVDLSKHNIMWCSFLQGVPEAVSSFLVNVMRHFKNDLKKAFKLIDGPDGNGKLSLMEFKTAVASLGWTEFGDPEKAVQIFRYLDPDGGGSISYEEWQVMSGLLKELQLTILELLQHVDYTFGGIEVAHALLDRDSNQAVDFHEWRKGIISMGYYGPSEVIYRYLCLDKNDHLTAQCWEEVVEMWKNREAVLKKIRDG